MKYDDFVELSEADSLTSFRSLLVEFAARLEFGLMTAMLVVDRPGTASDLIAISNTPEAFQEASKDERSANRDPVLARLKVSNLPFIYDQDLYVRSGAADLWEQQAPFGYKTGVSVALHLPGGKHFLMGFDRDVPLPGDEAKTARILADMQLGAVHAQHAALRLLAPRVSAPGLSAREREILIWSGRGKSASVVGQILGISAATVNYHIGRILARFECETKHQAILKALQWGLIEL